jgi:AcrR family transcriptional regulator
MPRGRAPGYELQREQILARAAELFATQGYTATTMNQVAQACGISKPALYHYVRDKYQLLVEIAEGQVLRLRDLAAGVNAQRLEPALRLRRLIESFVDAYSGSRAAHRVLTEDVRFLEPVDRGRLLDHQREVVDAFAAAVADARPALRDVALERPLTMLLFGMMNWMFTWLRPGGRLTHAAMAPIVADLFLGGLEAVRAGDGSYRPSRSSPSTDPGGKTPSSTSGGTSKIDVHLQHGVPE